MTRPSGSALKRWLFPLFLGCVVGMMAGGGAVAWYHFAWRGVYVSVLKNVHFLIRENDAASAEAALDKHAPLFDKQITNEQLARLARELRDAAREHVK